MFEASHSKLMHRPNFYSYSIHVEQGLCHLKHFSTLHNQTLCLHFEFKLLWIFLLCSAIALYILPHSNTVTITPASRRVRRLPANSLASHATMHLNFIFELTCCSLSFSTSQIFYFLPWLVRPYSTHFHVLVLNCPWRHAGLMYVHRHPRTFRQTHHDVSHLWSCARRRWHLVPTKLN